MQQTPFHAYYTARILDSLSDSDRLVPVFASSDIKVYPFQIAAANYASILKYYLTEQLGFSHCCAKERINLLRNLI